MGKQFISILKYLIHCLFEAIYPFKEECIICKEDTKEDFLLCRSCYNKIKFCESSYIVDKKNSDYYICFCLAYYSNIIAELILRLKYKQDYQCGEALGNMMSSMIAKNKLEADIITFVPCTKQALKKRGYNQSLLLAKAIGDNLRIKVVDCLLKVKDTKDQIGLNEEMRWANLRDSYKFNSDIDIANKKIILVDDVLTTGATTFFCAQQLMEGNASSVIVLTVAKSRL